MSQLRPLIEQLTHCEFVKEMEMYSVRQRVISLTRRNRETVAKIDEADRRIESLIRNYEAVVCKGISKDKKTKKSATNLPCGQYTMDEKKRLQLYERLCYQLQTRPDYLCTLFLHDSAVMSESLKQTVITGLFAYFNTDRESYLLLKLFDQMLDQEVKMRIKDPCDILKDSCKTIDMAIQFYRTHLATTIFKSLKFLIMDVIHEKEKSFSTDPIHVYKMCVASTKNGYHSSNNDVTMDEALRHPQVIELLHQSVNELIKTANRFIDMFCLPEFMSSVPYGLKFLSRSLWQAILNKFPNTSRKQLIKIISYVIYNRFIGWCIISPETNHVIKLKPHERITSEARNNLGILNKLLSAAASGSKSCFPLVEIDFYQSLALNTFMTNAHERFVEFFRTLLLIESPDDFFEMNEFTDETLMHDPQISMLQNDLWSLHKHVYDCRDLIITDVDDELDDILEELGPAPPAPKHLLNQKVASESSEETDVSLTLILRNRCGVVHNNLNPDERDKLFRRLKVKQAIMELIRHRKCCSDLNEVFFRPLGQDEEDEYYSARERMAREMSPETWNQSIIFSPHGTTLEDLLNFVRLNFQCLNARTFDEISDQIMTDVTHRLEHSERFEADLTRMKTTLQRLEDKKVYCENQLKAYQDYMDCIKKLNNTSKRLQETGHRTNTWTHGPRKGHHPTRHSCFTWQTTIYYFS